MQTNNFTSAVNQRLINIAIELNRVSLGQIMVYYLHSFSEIIDIQGKTGQGTLSPSPRSTALSYWILHLSEI